MTQRICVTVAHRTLTPFAGVRIPHPLPENALTRKSEGVFAIPPDGCGAIQRTGYLPPLIRRRGAAPSPRRSQRSPKVLPVRITAAASGWDTSPVGGIWGRLLVRYQWRPCQSRLPWSVRFSGTFRIRSTGWSVSSEKFPR